MNKLLPFSLLLLLLISCHSEDTAYRKQIDLQGQWQFRLDTADTGIQNQWYLSGFDNSLTLPGTTDSNKKGFRNTDTTTLHLNRPYTYEGVAWYRKKIHIPQKFEDKYIRLFLERTKPSMVWVDSLPAGRSDLLQSPQQFNLSPYLSPGTHYLTLRIDNRKEKTPYGGSHIYSDDTQTNWNGIIGKMFIEAMPHTHISNLQVFPDIDNKKIDIELEVKNHSDVEDLSIKLIIEHLRNGKPRRLESKTITKTAQPVLKLEYVLGEKAMLWDEYQQPLYQLTAIISHGDTRDAKTVPFGMREFTVHDTHFRINGRTTFLRGKHEAAVFPINGHTPMDVESWKRVYRIAKKYGINHYRFHSYCPPEAAFTAADQTGIYLQAELPFWGGLESDTTAHMLREEGKAMLKAYANHPSFVMFSHGNELWSGHNRVEENIRALKNYDDRPLYTMGANNNIGYVWPREISEFYIGARTPYEKDTILTHTRLTHAFVDSRDGGILNTQTPSTRFDFSYPVSQIDIPVVSHEIGQYQIYPDYREIKKYTGVLRAWNLEIFRNQLKDAGMLDQDSAFQQASGAWSAICYKAEMEAALRTRGMAGFQLLDLQDFPGQGTALVGILDAFMDSKGVVSRDEWLESCNDVVILAEFSKYCRTNQEDYSAQIEVANYSNQSIKEALSWKLVKQNGATVDEGTWTDKAFQQGELTVAGQIRADLSPIKKAQKLSLKLALSNSPYTQDYPVWVFPPAQSIKKPADIIVSRKLDKELVTQLEGGARVLLFPQTKDVRDHSVPGLFPPDFWNYEMFKGISERNDKPVSPGTLGILTDPEHPVFQSFPTDFHTNWQWFSIIKAGNSMILDDTPGHYRPIVQVIDNLQRNHKMGLIFEFKAGKGKLLVCMSQLPDIKDKLRQAKPVRRGQTIVL